MLQAEIIILHLAYIFTIEILSVPVYTFEHEYEQEFARSLKQYFL